MSGARLSHVAASAKYFLPRTPSPQIIMEAFAQVRPKLIVAVPLIIEKIVKTRIFPLLEKPLMKLAMHLPFVDNKLLEKIKEQLEKAFGGQLKEIIIGGAGLNADVEAFLRRIKFPFTVGYGMTECGRFGRTWANASMMICGEGVRVRKYMWQPLAKE